MSFPTPQFSQQDEDTNSVELFANDYAEGPFRAQVNGTFVRGTLIALVDGGPQLGKFAEYNPVGIQSRNIAKAVLASTMVATTGEDVFIRVLVSGQVRLERLRVQGEVDSFVANSPALQDELRQVGIDPIKTKPLASFDN